MAIKRKTKTKMFLKGQREFDQRLVHTQGGFFNWKIISPILVLVLMLISSLVYAQTLDGKVYPGVNMGGVNLSGLSYKQAEKTIEQHLIDYRAETIGLVHYNNSWQPDLNDLGLSYNISATTDYAYAIGRNNSWIDSLIAPVYALSSGDVINPELVVQKNQLDDYLAQIAEQVRVEPIQPRFKFSYGQVEIILGENGLELDTELLKAQILNTALRLEPIYLALPMIAVEPLNGPEVLTRLLAQAEDLLSSPLVLRSGDHEYTFEPNELVAWVTVVEQETEQGQDWTLAIDEQVVNQSLSNKITDVAVEPIALVTYQAREPVNPLHEGQDGLALDVDGTLTTIKEQWVQEKVTDTEISLMSVSRPVEYLDVEAPRSEGKSILVNLTDQSVFAFNDGVLQFYTRASTGKAWTPTKVGEYKVYSKVRRQKMSGPGYYLPGVQWVMFYDGDYSLHGTYWHENFGHPMSHGCTNLSNEDAERFFNFADVGTPVIVVGETPRS